MSVPFPSKAGRAARPFGAFALVLVACWLCACGGSSKDSGRVQATEAVDPPKIARARIGVEQAEAGDVVQVTGSAGSVRPGGLEVEVTNVMTQESVTVTTAEDGSFSAEIDGSAGDGYRVVVANESGSADAEVSGEGLPSRYECLLETGAEVYKSTSGGPECDRLNQEAACRFARAEQDSDESCVSDEDCVETGSAPSCIDTCGYGTTMSRTAARALKRSIEKIDQDVCADFDAAGCSYFASSCPTIASGSWAPPELACIDGQCERLSGCALGTRLAERLLRSSAVELATGCVTDADCQVSYPSACAWSCPDTAVIIASGNEADFADLKEQLQATCESALAGEDCSPPPCEGSPDIAAVCESGVCIDPAQPAPECSFFPDAGVPQCP